MALTVGVGAIAGSSSGTDSEVRAGVDGSAQVGVQVPRPPRGTDSAIANTTRTSTGTMLFVVSLFWVSSRARRSARGATDTSMGLF